MATIITSETSIPAGLSGIMSYSHVKVGSYPVQMENPECICTVIIKEATDRHLVFALEVSESFERISETFLFQIMALEASGVLQRKLVYYKD